MSQKGSLSKVSFGKLLTWLNSQEKSGTLKISRDKRAKFLILHKGEITSAFSEYPEDHFKSVIKRMDLLPEAKMMELGFEPGLSDGEFARQLVEKGYFTEREFIEIVKRLNQDIILSLFEWRSGDFDFYEDRFPKVQAITLKVAFSWVMEKGMERYHLRQEIDQKLSVGAFFKVREEAVRQHQIKAHPQKQIRRIFQALTEPKTIRDIVEETCLTDFEVTYVITRFVEEGHIEAVSEKPAKLSKGVQNQLALVDSLYSKDKFWEAFMTMKNTIKINPSHPELKDKYQFYTQQFEKDMRSVITSSDLVPEILKPLDEKDYSKFPDESELGFLISRIDGQSNLTELAKVLNVEHQRLYLTLYLLVKAGVVKLSKRKGPVPEELVKRRQFARDVWEKIQDQDYYEIIGIPQNASEADIKSAYFDLAKQFHPDARQETDPEDVKERLDTIFVMIRDAYRTLSDAESRKEYDRKLTAKSEELDIDVLKSKTKAQLQFAVGIKSLDSREYRTAMEYFRSAIDLDPYEPKYYGKLGEVCTKNPRWYRAGILSCRKAIQINPDDSSYYSVLGTLYKLDGNFIEAEKQLNLVLQMDPDNHTARLELKAMGKKVPTKKGSRKDTEFAPIPKKKKS